ncbi:MAG: extracellular solute-binding protein [Oscillospiraceae bacterium]|nr:extracellular solute-binding protein [Oscillospiraceae bacterium]
MAKMRIRLIQCAIVVLLILASCSQSVGDTQTTPPETGAVTLRVWTWRRNYNGEALKIAHEHFKRSHPDVEIDIANIGRDEILSRLKIKLSIKDYEGLPDIVLIEDYQIQEFLRKFPGEIRALSPALDMGTYEQCAVKAVSLDGVMYGTPLDSGAAVMFYRADCVEAAGYSAEDMENLTWAKYIEIGKAVKEKTGMLMLTLTPTDLWQIRLMLQSVGQWYVKDDGLTVNLADNPALKDAINTYISIVKSGIALQVSGYDQEYGAVEEGRVATVLTGSWRFQTMASIAKAQEGKWAITRIPRMDIQDSVNSSALGGYAWYILDKAENADVALDFLLSTLPSDMDLIDELAGELDLVYPLKGAGDLPEYSKPYDSFYGRPTLKNIFDMIKDVPPVDYGMHTYPIDRLIEYSVQLIMQGADIDVALQNAQIAAEAIT